MYDKQLTELQRIAGLSREEAKRILLEQLDRTLSDEKAALIKAAEQATKNILKRRICNV